MTRKNILFIMCDQLRFDYLSCTGHPHLRTPNIDSLAERGVRFENCFVQSTICGPSRMSAYTGRYVRSHGSTQNGIPLRVGEPTLGDHLRNAGARAVLVGKTHMAADREGMKRLGIDPLSCEGVLSSQCGFEPFERDDGLHPDGYADPKPAYDDYLRRHGFDAANPWEQHWANSGISESGEILNGWLLSHADKAARIPEQLSETPYMTRRAMEFMTQAQSDDRPWCLHLSYIKPHWPYIVPAPYHAMYDARHVVPAVRSEAERVDAHPVFDAFMKERYSLAFADEKIRQHVIPAYMGLIKQIDDQIGVLLQFLEERGLASNTMIVFTSDHGDYLGDHWLGEKYLFHDPSVKVPLIIFDPGPEADATRGVVRSELVEMIDLAPTFLDVLGGLAMPHILEGRSLMPLLRDRASPDDWRRHAISEYDYSMDLVRLRLKQKVEDCRLTMVTDGRWKLIHAENFRPMLFDSVNDPDELIDLGGQPGFEAVVQQLYAAMNLWLRHGRNRITVSDAWIQVDDATALDVDPNLSSGILIGYWDEAELAEEKRKQREIPRKNN